MGFDVSPELKMILDTKREFLHEEIIPLERLFLNHEFETLFPLLEEKRQKAKVLGLWLPQIPLQYGGMGLSLLEHGFVSEVLGQSPLGHYVFNCQAPDAGNMEILIEYGTAEQQERFLKPLLAGEIRSCFSMTEPENPGSNPTWMSSTAQRDGDEYIIEGHKWFTSAADGAAFAIVMAVTDPHAARHKRASMIIVPTDTTGFHIVENTSVMVRAGTIVRIAPGSPVTPKSVTRTVTCPWTTCWARKGLVLSLPNNVLAQDAFITVCAGSAFVSVRLI